MIYLKTIGQNIDPHA
jgi:hypothetical protein